MVWRWGYCSLPSISMNSDILNIIKAKLWQCVNTLPLSHQVHRVLIPEGELKRRVPRRSLVLFYDPDDDIMITCLDGSNKYPPMRARDWIYHRLHSTFKY